MRMKKHSRKPDSEGISDIHYQGSAILRLAGYMKPFAGAMTISLVMVLCITVL